MVKLIARSPAEDALPVTIGALTLNEVRPAGIVSVTLFGEPSGDLPLPFPDPNRITRDGDAMAIWAGRDTALFLDAAPEGAGVVLTDQSDGWAVFDLVGGAGDTALARLCPIDTRLAQFPTGHTARTLLGHMNASVSRIADDTLRIMVFRSMARTAIHDLTRAMEHANR